MNIQEVAEAYLDSFKEAKEKEDELSIESILFDICDSDLAILEEIMMFAQIGLAKKKEKRVKKTDFQKRTGLYF